MLDFEEIKKQYPPQMQVYERAILREYLQCKIIQALFESNHAHLLSFLGGTALRIMHDNNRFSEDIDLDNFGLGWEDFEKLIKVVQTFLEFEGFTSEIRSVDSGAFHCYIKFPGMLFQNKLSPYKEEKILIQIDTFAQGFDYKPDLIVLNKFDVFSEIRVTPLSILLSQKIFTSINRKRPKGRDFYDITMLLRKTKPDYGFLSLKMEIEDPQILKSMYREKIQAYDFNKLAEDVRPFLMRSQDEIRVLKFKEFWETAQLD